MKQLIACVIVGMVATLANQARAEVKPAPVFADHMVLQREMAVPVWGTANPREKVVVRFRAQEKTIEAGADGRWMLKLDPLTAGGPEKLQIGPVTIDDVLVGEVWFGAGQSNMAVGAGGAAKTDPVMARLIEKDYPTIRIGSAKGNWRIAVAKTNPSLPALPLSFAVRLQEKLNIPVGVAVGCVGGTSTEFWLTPEHLSADPACREAIDAYAKNLYPGLKKKWEEDVARWEKSPAATRPDSRPRPPAEPGKTNMANHIVGKLFEEHIRPAIPMAMRGVLWDQGENTSAAAGPNQTQVMNALIRGWRKDWAQGEFPFVFVQKPSGGGCAWEENDITQQSLPFAPLPEKVPGDNDGRYREFFLNILQTPNTAMAIASDLAPGTHPPTKSAYGTRAARAALALAYGEKIEIYGPLYASHQVEGSKVRIKFTHIGQGLVFKGGEKLQGFTIAGADRKFVWADAQIDGETVVVFSPSVPEPRFIRYAWADKCPWANLFNKDGLPAQALRIDGNP